MAVVQVLANTRKKTTEEEFLNRPRDGRRWELVDGEAREVPAGHEHDAIGANIIMLIGPHARGRGIVAGAQAGFVMNSGNVRAPDVAFTRKERLRDGKPSRKFEHLAPDLAVEILSPSDDIADLPRKVSEYFASGSEQVWLLEPALQRATVYLSLTESRRYEADEELDGGTLLPGFRCRIADLFTQG